MVAGVSKISITTTILSDKCSFGIDWVQGYHDIFIGLAGQSYKKINYFCVDKTNTSVSLDYE